MDLKGLSLLNVPQVGVWPRDALKANLLKSTKLDQIFLMKF